MTSTPPKILPHEIIRPARWREILITIVGAIALLIGANSAADWFLDYLSVNRGYFLISRKWDILSELKQPADWLILGDSSCNQGVIPERLSQTLGGTAVNLCTFGPLLTLDDAWLLHEHIQQLGPPKQVVIVHVYDIWQRDVEEDTIAHIAQIPRSPAEIEAFDPPLELSREDQIKLFLHRNVPLYSSNETLSDWIREPLTSFHESREFTVSQSGFMPIEQPKPKYVRRDMRNHLESVRQENVAFSEINRAAMQRIQQLAEQYDFDVFLANSPIYEGLYQERDFQRYFRKVQQQLIQFDRGSDRIHYVLRDPVTFSADQMRNTDHVITSAAEIYSDRLAQAIQRVQLRSQNDPITN
jgi:hypothetical protein